MNILITCKAGFEETLAREIVFYNLSLERTGRGWIHVQEKHPASLKSGHPSLADLCFAYHLIENPTLVRASSVNRLAESFSDSFTEHIRPMRIVQPWSFLFSSSGDEQLIHRAKTVQALWLEKIQKKMSRVAKLSKEGMPRGPNFTEGFFVHFVDFDQAFVSFKAFSQGQQRMSMDAEAPSRSFLKLEEAFRVFGREPHEGERVVDLGAAPGGWSYSALKRGALVTAVDNGPLKDPVKSYHGLHHLTVDAFSYKPDEKRGVDWLLCDILEKPDMILNLLHKWLSNPWCHYFIVNLKVGRADPIFLLKEVKDPQRGLLPYCHRLIMRHLYHDREEITLMGETISHADGF